ncbi:proton-coupled amino acid transporter-like protein pathetic [Rhopalosiphum padi]|uniref:proton-coupled amino acid transporter-like protein pathetic n=1 Tax=Rhopalosiphum padi TaxID=40932 RepID=UPI00298D8567|nr:proton-coupled amino acid transporter-like protein pathetic [Rhopalosiphum padi]
MKHTVNSKGRGANGNNGNDGDGNVGTQGWRHVKGGEKQLPYDPFQMRDNSNSTTATGALLHLIKSSLGSGVLAMPNAFKNGGLIFGLFGTAAIGALCAHCIYLLVLCSQTLARRTRRPALGFADTAYLAFKTGPHRFRAWASFAKGFVNAALFCTYYFGNCVYVILVSASFKQVADNHTPEEWHFSIRTWILGLALPILPLGIIRSLRVLVPFSAVATTFILVGLGCSMVWVVVGVSPFSSKEAVLAAVPLPDMASRPWVGTIAHMPLFFATVVFAMEGIGTVLPIENSMRHPEHFLRARPCGVLNAAMTLVVFLYSIAGFLGYLRFGNTTEGSITLNLPNDLFAEAVKIMVTLSILFSYGLQFCVPSEIVWSRLGPWLHKRKLDAKYCTPTTDKETSTVSAIAGTIVTMTTVTSTMNHSTNNEKKQTEEELDEQEKFVDWEYYVMRALMILGTFGIAAIVPNLAPIISLFGAVFFSILGLLCPAAIHLVVFWNHFNDNGDHNEDSDSENDLRFDGVDNYAMFDDMSIECGGITQRQQERRMSSDELGTRKKGMSRLTAAKDVAIILLALFAMVSGAYASLVDIFHSYGSSDKVNSTIAMITTTIGPGPETAYLTKEMN